MTTNNTRPNLWNCAVAINREFPNEHFYVATEEHGDTMRLSVLRRGTHEPEEIIECADLRWLYYTGRSLLRATLKRQERFGRFERLGERLAANFEPPDDFDPNPEASAHYREEIVDHLLNRVPENECGVCESQQPDYSEATSPAGWDCPEPDDIGPHGGGCEDCQRSWGPHHGGAHCNPEHFN